jgi:hypothetical protein
MKAMRSSSTAVATALLALAAGCGSSGSSDKPAATGSLPQGGEPVKLDPASFSTRIDNQWMPLAPGSVWVYREGKTTDRVEVLHRTKVIDGVRTRVVHDVAKEGGRVIEDTFDWFAQDLAGNVWYLGEDTKEFSGHGPPSAKGSWQAGVNDAQAGVVMPAKPKLGQSYRQEYLKGEAEDRARVLSLDESAQVPAGYYKRTLMTKDYSPLERLVEHKFYARGVGNVLTVATAGESSREELVSFRRGSG